MRPLAVIGNLARDHVDGRQPRVGGGAYYGARALRLLGRPGRVVTRCSRSDSDLLRPLVALGLPVDWRPAAPTAAFSLSYTGGERAMRVDDVAPPWTPDDARGWAVGALRGVEWAHVAPLVRSDFPPETLAVLARGRRLSLDGQGLVRRPETGPLTLDADFDRAVLRHVAVLKLAEEEASTLGALDANGLRALGVAEAVVTLGSRGSLVWWRGRLEPVAAAPASVRVDPTGAGDAFAVAYLAARAIGYAPPAAARRASLVVSAFLSGR